MFYFQKMYKYYVFFTNKYKNISKLITTSKIINIKLVYKWRYLCYLILQILFYLNTF